jgi:hypothetical protein
MLSRLPMPPEVWPPPPSGPGGASNDEEDGPGPKHWRGSRDAWFPILLLPPQLSPGPCRPCARK